MSLTPSEILKFQTSHLHSILDELPIMKDLMSERVTMGTYGSVLNGLYACFAPLEDFLREDASFSETWNYSFKTFLLEQDLSALGHALPVRAPLPDFPSEESTRVGIAYVLFGSSLGGTFISKHLGQCLNLSDLTGKIAFYRSSHESVLKWKDFKKRIDQSFPPTSHELKNVILAAQNTFQLFINSLT